ncbi:MAG: hypothetical protein GWP10_16010 [Nitrospiraceae bacterium]|nr:hypothetical protein [Nitrospiraceae bacterium]
MPATVDIAANPIVNPLDGTTITSTTVTISDIKWSLDDPQTRHICVDVGDPNLYARITGPVNTPWSNSMVPGGSTGATYTANSTVATTYTFNLEVKGTPASSGTHTVTVRDNYGTSYSPLSVNDTTSCTRPVDIPEFATIAIPMIALLGLVLYMRRKND